MRDLKRRKREEFNQREEKKIITSAYLPSSTKKLLAFYESGPGAKFISSHE